MTVAPNTVRMAIGIRTAFGQLCDQCRENHEGIECPLEERRRWKEGTILGFGDEEWLAKCDG